MNYLTANSPTNVSFFALVRFTMSCHGCMLKTEDGTNKIISGSEKCIMPTDKCMWKYPSGVPNGMKTRSKANNGPTAGYEEVNKYFATKYFIHRWVVFLYNKVYLLIYNY